MSEEKKNPFVSAVTDTADQTDTMDKNDVDNNKFMGVLAYLFILVLIPIFAAKNSKFARFHANQGLVLCIIGCAHQIISAFTAFITTIISKIPVINILCLIIDISMSLIGILLLVYAILGIVYVVQGKAKDLPFIGGIKILK